MIVEIGDHDPSGLALRRWCRQVGQPRRMTRSEFTCNSRGLSGHRLRHLRGHPSSVVVDDITPEGLADARRAQPASASRVRSSRQREPPARQRLLPRSRLASRAIEAG